MPQTSFTHAELELLWVLHGGLEQDADTAAAIAQAESGGCLYAKAGPVDDRPAKLCTYRYTTGENSYGLWQINRRAHPQYSAASLFTAGGNATAAVAIAKLGANFEPWSTYVNGAYKQYLTGTVSVTPQPGPTYTPAPPAAGASSMAGFHQVGLVLARGLPGNLHRSSVLGRATLRNLAKSGKVR